MIAFTGYGVHPVKLTCVRPALAGHPRFPARPTLETMERTDCLGGIAFKSNGNPNGRGMPTC